ncbi:MAG: alpha/beta hydrolase [Alphaproteobacteria bacterium]|nr:alpha/beta hydrolase [Alphaproteobacteria bacterium]
MSVLALSGWAQYAASLDAILPDNALKVEYGDCTSVEAVFNRIQSANIAEPDVAIGWSLGGQLLVRAIAAGVIAPKHLVLLGAPYQVVADKYFKAGKNKFTIGASRLALKVNADAMLQQFQADLLAKGDSNSAHIKAIAPQYLAPSDCNAWLFWFDELERFSCRDLKLSNFPPTTIVHGKNDAVIPYPNSLEFADKIKNSTLHSLENCGHAPHWHDTNFVKSIIPAS